MRHVLFTEPSAPQAGQDMTVFYNPSNTCLSSASEVFITVSALACPPAFITNECFTHQQKGA